MDTVRDTGGGSKLITASRRRFLQSSLVAAAGAMLASDAPGDIFDVGSAWEPVSDKKVRIGVVGGNFGTAFHWHEHPNCVVGAVSDLFPERRKALVDRYRCDKTYASLEELVRDPAIDAVALFTGAPDHAKHTLLCMQHGKHVISACPACMTLDEAAQMKEMKEKTGLKYMNAETSYYRWPTILARELMQQGKFGELVYCEGEYYHPLPPEEKQFLTMLHGERTWRYGFPPMHYPTHSTAFLVGVTRERLVKVSCVCLRDSAEPMLEDNAYGNPFLNGHALCLTDHGHPFRFAVGLKITADGERAEWYGSKGAMYMESSGGQPFILQLEGKQTTQLPDYFQRLPEKMRYDTGHGKSHPFLCHEFILSLIEDREPAIDLYESLAFTVPGIIAHQSALKDGEQLEVPSFDRA